MCMIKEIFDEIYKNVILSKQVHAPFIIGINGIDTSGKTEFAKKFKEYLIAQNHKVQMIHIDDFHNSKDIRYSGKDEVENYFYRSFNIERLVNHILKPVKTNGSFQDKVTLLNLETDRYDIEKEYCIDQDTFVILEGVFILRDEIEPYLDYSIFIHIPFEQCKERALNRDVPLYGEEVLKKYDAKYIPTQKYYLKKYPPERYVDIIIDNSDWNKPKIIPKRKIFQSFIF